MACETQYQAWFDANEELEQLQQEQGQRLSLKETYETEISDKQALLSPLNDEIQQAQNVIDPLEIEVQDKLNAYNTCMSP